MDTHGFWSLIDQSVDHAQGDTERQLQFLRDHLGSMGKNEVTDFQTEYDRAIAEARSWRLWGAAYLINGGCSDDGFEYLCAWRIGQGSSVFRAAMADPDSLSSVCDPDRDDYEFEDLNYVGADVFQELTASDSWPESAVRIPSEPAGEDWDFDDDSEMCRRFARLWCQRSE